MLTSALAQSADEVNKTIHQLHKGVERRLRKHSTDEVSFAMLRKGKDVRWKREPALWISVDGTDAVGIYNSLDTLVVALRETLPAWEGNELSRYVMDMNWPYVGIVPLVCGKAFSAAAWRIYLPNLLAENNNKLGLKWQVPGDYDGE